MRRDRLRHAVKLNEDEALLKPILIDARRQPTRQETAARGLKRWASELGVRREGVLITYRAVRRNPICFSHSFEKCLVGSSTCASVCVPPVRVSPENGACRPSADRLPALAAHNHAVQTPGRGAQPRTPHGALQRLPDGGLT